MTSRRAISISIAALLLGACSSSADGPQGSTVGSSPSGSIVGGTANVVPDVGALPPSLPSVAPPATDAEGEPEPSTTVEPTTTLPPVDSTIGAIAGGNRVLMLGDSILASTSKRYGRQMCDVMVPLGWQVEIEAEVSRNVDWGLKVLKDRLDADWDAGLILLGNNYGADKQHFFIKLNEIITMFEPRPVVLLTVTEFEPLQQEVNEIIRALAEVHPNVTLLDWQNISNLPKTLGGDGLHLTDGGRKLLATVVATEFGAAPAKPGECLDSKYHDDSAGSVNGGKNTGSNKPPSRPPVTTPRTTTTTPVTTPPTTPSGGTTGTTTPSGGTTATTTGTTTPSGGTTGTTTPSGGTSPPASSQPASSSPGTTAGPVVTTSPPAPTIPPEPTNPGP